MARFARILPEYKAAPEITRERLYIETMEKVLSQYAQSSWLTIKAAT